MIIAATCRGTIASQDGLLAEDERARAACESMAVITEGFDTPDLKETKALLEEINRRATHAPTKMGPQDITRDRAE